MALRQRSYHAPVWPQTTFVEAVRFHAVRRSQHGRRDRQTWGSDVTEEQQPPAPGITPRALAQKQARAQREAAALRENLRRRKQQARTREAAPLAEPTTEKPEPT
jgi:hypothetical protein